MTKEELERVATDGIQQLGFARIAMPAILKVFASEQQPSYEIHEKLTSFAESHGWTIQHESGEFVVFYPAGTEPKQAS